MINKKKIQKMAQDAVYLLHGYRKDSCAAKYYKNDYLGSERIKNLIIFTIFYALYVLYELGRDFYVATAPDFLHFDYQGYIIERIVIYLVLAVILSAVTTLCASLRYDAAQKDIDQHNEVVSELTKRPKHSWLSLLLHSKKEKQK